MAVATAAARISCNACDSDGKKIVRKLKGSAHSPSMRPPPDIALRHVTLLCAADAIDEFIKKKDDPEFWRTVRRTCDV